jgi:hypothetical protein
MVDEWKVAASLTESEPYHRAMTDGEAPGDLANFADGGGTELYFFDTKV